MDTDLQRGQYPGCGVGGPLPDRDIGPGPGHDRRSGQRQDRDQLVADPAAVARIGHRAQRFGQVTAAVLAELRCIPAADTPSRIQVVINL